MVVCLSEALAQALAVRTNEVERDEEITQQQLRQRTTVRNQITAQQEWGRLGTTSSLERVTATASFAALYIVCEASRLSRERVSAHVHVMFCRESASLHMCIDCIGYPDFSLRFLA
jgi:hypothetical protein